MLRLLRIILAGVVVLGIAAQGRRTMASPITDALVSVADRLVSTQTKTGAARGSWPQATDFTGTILIGMVGAYEDTCDGDYVTVLTRAGDYILRIGQGLYYGEEAWGLVRLGDTVDASYRTAVVNFFHDVKYVNTGGTAGFISLWNSSTPSAAVIDFAHYAVAAYAVDAEDKALWRQAILTHLRRMSDDTEDYPVLTLAVATWGLTLTGPMDGTLVKPGTTGQALWNSVTLADLPAMVADHQVPAGGQFDGSFYWRLDKTDGGYGVSWPAGYTEETVFGTLALMACRDKLGLDYDDGIARARTALLGGVGAGGVVDGHLFYDDVVSHLFAGEMANVLGALTCPADLDLDGRVDAADYSRFAAQWGAAGCTGCSWCNGADLDRNGAVDFADLEVFVGNYWLAGAGY